MARRGQAPNLITRLPRRRNLRLVRFGLDLYLLRNFVRWAWSKEDRIEP